MERDALAAILDSLAADQAAGRQSGARLVDACVEAVEVTGAGIMLMVDDEHRGTLGFSDPAIRLVEELQFTLGEGPCVDACRSGVAVLEPRLAAPEVARWPEFSGPVVDAGVEAIFGFPLQVGATCIGALDLYQDRPGDLSHQQMIDAWIMAEVVTHAVLGLQATEPPGSLSPGIAELTSLRAVVHQASGMLSVQLDLPVGDALSRLRAHAYAEERPVHEVAQDVVERRLNLD